MYKTEFTMSIPELKKDFHDLIDSIDNENLLAGLYDFIKERVKNEDGKLLDSLTVEEREELYLSFDESKDLRNLKSHGEISKKRF